MLAPGSGIKLPLETDADGAASMLVDDDLIAFSHRVAEPVQQHDSMDIMVRNGGDVMAQ